MADETPTAMESITVTTPLSKLNVAKIMTDPQGNSLYFPGTLRKRFHVKHPDGSEHCIASKVDAMKLNALIPDDTRRLKTTYDFQAPAGSIPDLCKKDGQAK